MKQCPVELSFDQVSGRTFLIDSVQGTQMNVRVDGDLPIYYRPNLTGIASYKQRVELDYSLTRYNYKMKTLRPYTPRQDKFCGYAQFPNVRLNQDFMQNRFKPQLKTFHYDIGTFHNNSYNKPRTIQGGLNQKKYRTLINVNENSLNNDSIQYLTATIKDSREALQKNEIIVLESRNITKNKQVFKQLNTITKKNQQILSKTINGNFLKSPDLKIMKKITQIKCTQDLSLSFYDLIKKYKHEDKKHNQTLDPYFQEKKQQQTLNQSFQHEDSDIQQDKIKLYLELKHQQFNPSFTISNMYALENKLPPDQLEKIKFYFSKQDISEFEKSKNVKLQRPKLRRLTTQKIQTDMRRRKEDISESYPMVLFQYNFKIKINNKSLYERNFE